MDDEKRIKEILGYAKILKSIRQPYETNVDAVLEFVYHSRRKINDNETNRGNKTGTRCYDGTALSALNLARDGITGYSASKSFRWFNYTLPGRLAYPRASGMRRWSGKRIDEYPDVKIWLEEAEEAMYSSFMRSNLYDQLPVVVGEALGPGTISADIEEDVGKGRIVMTVPHFRECCIAEDRYGAVDTLYREYSLNMIQLVEKFGKPKMESSIPNFDKLFESNPYKEYKVLRARFPRDVYDLNISNGANKPWASIWILMDKKGMLLEESGTEFKSFVTWRWWKNSDEIYGRSPSWDALVTIMTGHEQAKTNLIAGQKSAEPPMIAPESMRGKVNKGANGWTFVDNFNEKQLPHTLEEIQQLPFAIEQLERTDKAIREHFHVDFFLMISQAAMAKVEMTAYQVMEMGSEKAAILGTRIGRFESEFLNQVHDIYFDIESRAGRIPRPPDILLEQGGNIEIDYLGPLAQAQKRMFKSQVIRSGIQAIGEFANVFPEMRYRVNALRTSQDFLESIGFPLKNINDDDTVAKALEAEAEAKKNQEMAEQASKIMKALPGAGKAVEQNSPMAAMTGMGSGEGASGEAEA